MANKFINNMNTDNLNNWQRFQLEHYGNILKEHKTWIEIANGEELENGEHDGYSIFDSEPSEPNN